jgi:DNA-binding transcriptional LysR family regulator
MDTNRLRYFSTIAATGSLAKAADLLHMSSPALSKSIRVLEGEVGVELIRRKGRGIELTEEGRLLATRIGPLLEELASIPDEIATRRHAERPIRYASHESFGTYFVRLLLAEHPATVFEHRYLVPGAIEQAIVDGVVDLGLSYLPVPTPGVELVRAGRIRMGVYGRPQWQKRSFDKWRFAAPALPPIAAAIRPQGLDGWPDDRIPRTVAWRVTHTETALELCREGVAVACFPSFLVELHNASTVADQRLERIESSQHATEWHQTVHVLHREGDAPQALALFKNVVRSLRAS